MAVREMFVVKIGAATDERFSGLILYDALSSLVYNATQSN